MVDSDMNDRALKAGLRSPAGAIQPAPPPPPPPRSKRGGVFHWFSSVLTFVLMLAVGAVFALYLIERQFDEPGPLVGDKVVIVKGGSQAVASTLEREGVIAHPTLFMIGIHVYGSREGTKAGEYLFKQHASLLEVMDALISGRSVLHPITIPEGLTSEQIVARLKDVDVLSGDITEMPREGALLPETYKVPRGTSRQQLLERMTTDQGRILKEVWARRAADLPIKTPQELLILASIVEKETGRADERPRVAGVFINRLIKRMKLQSDPTIVYGLAGGKGTLGRSILRSEIDKPTPYNTYAIEGLPPGPIANPGRAALEAVANPSRTKEVYFVADGSGGHVFAETLDQHQKNVAKWRQIEASRGGGKTPDRVDSSDPSAPAATQGVRNAPTGAQNAAAFAPVDRAPAADGIEELNQATGKSKSGSAVAGPVPPRRPKTLDASEGTRKDPLLNKNFDLNSAKTIPTLR